MEIGYHKKSMAGKRLPGFKWRPYAKTKHTPSLRKISQHKRRK